MPIPDPTRPSEDFEPAASGSSDEPAAEPVGMVPAIESPTVHRGSSLSARKQLAAQPAALAPAVALPVPGQVIDGFRLEEAIGVGGMGAVFRARDTKLDRQVALKLLPPDQATDAEIVPRFYQEGRSAARLDHENIARVFSIGQDGPFHYIAFEYIEGVTVRQRVETSGLLSVREAVHIVIQIAQALVHAAERGVVHRDIKPSNMIIRPDGRAKLVDMGLARRFERGGDHGLTQSGMTLGTFDYISPEQARDPRDVDVRSDLYSLGCTFFHMLTGRPPFPGGTALQKLIQHHEEAPPDVRTLNPQVPVVLANIIAKLMAKDRDRRYQTPEHLVRDLLGLAGAIGLATGIPAFPAGNDDGPAPTWERHLAWLVPAVGLVAVVAILAWLGRGLAQPAAPFERQSAPAVARRSPEPNVVAGPRAEGPPLPADSAATTAEATNNAPAYSRIIPVTSNEDLMEVLAAAPRRSVIVLADDGPFRLGGRIWSYRAPASLANADLTIKAEAGVRPVLKFDTDALSAERPPSSLLHFIGGHVTIEGLEFELDVVLPDELVAAIRADATELTVRGCSFRRTNSREGRNVAALQVRPLSSQSVAGERPPAVFADTCHFDGGQTAILTEGPADIVLRDCTMGPGQPSIWFDNTRSKASVAGELHIFHTSVLAGTGPIVRFDGSQVRVWIEDSVIAGAGRSSATLVMIDDPRDLTWRGRSNLYGGIGVYMAFSGEGERQEPIVDYPRWKETATELRETGTMVATSSVWDAADPGLAQATETDNPTRVFLLKESIAARMDVGARRGPFGSVLKNVRVAERSRPDDDDLPAAAPSGAGSDSLTRSSGEPASRKDDKNPVPDPMPVAAAADPSVAPSPEDPMNLPAMPPVIPAAAVAQTTPAGSAVGPDSGALQAPEPPRHEEPARAALDTNDPLRANRERRPSFDDEDVIRSAEQFIAMFNRLGSRGGTLRLAPGADLDLPAITIEGTAPYQLLAEPGARRPRLRFRPSQVGQRRPADWLVMLNLRSGSLHLQGIDLIVPDQEAIQTDRLAAAGLLPGSELTMTDCTLTVTVNRPGAALFVVQPEIAPPPVAQTPGGAAGPTAVIRVRDSFLRSGGEGIAVAAGRRLDLELSNVVVSTEASLVHAFGGIRPGRADSPALKIRMDQVNARVKGGLVYLDSTLEEPELPFAAIVAENSIVSMANRDDPLFRLDGRDQLDALGDKVRWDGRKVAYDRIKTYRRDEVVRTGVSPRIYDRASWTSAFLPKDESPMLGDVKFLRETDPSQAAWKLDRDDFRLAPQSPVADTGPDLSRISQAPAAGEL